MDLSLSVRKLQHSHKNIIFIACSHTQIFLLQVCLGFMCRRNKVASEEYRDQLGSEGVKHRPHCFCSHPPSSALHLGTSSRERVTRAFQGEGCCTAGSYTDTISSYVAASQISTQGWVERVHVCPANLPGLKCLQ